MIRFLFICAFLSIHVMSKSAVAPAEIHPNTSNKITYQQLLNSGIEAFYQTDWYRAEKIFRDLKKMDQNDPRAYFLDSLIPFWAYFFAGEQKKHADAFLDTSEQAIKLSAKQLKENPSDTNMVLMLSALHGYRSLVAANEKKYSIAIQNGMDGFNYTRQILALDSEDPRALIGKGIFLYMMGSIPGQVKWLANMAGLRGDAEQGIKLLKMASQSASYVSTDARMILYYLFEKEGRFSEAMDQIKKLAKKFPDNVIFQFKLASCQEKLGMEQEARASYRRVLSLNNTYLDALKTESKIRLNAIRS